MNKALTTNRLAEELSKESDLSSEAIKAVLNQASKLIGTSLILGRPVRIQGLGTFNKRMTKPRNIFNPKTESINLTLGRSKAFFKPSPLLNNLLNQS
jgi:nucleoid DNA-binding protein